MRIFSFSFRRSLGIHAAQKDRNFGRFRISCRGITPEGFYWTHVAKPEWQTLNVGDVLKQREPEEGAEKKVETKPRKKLTFPSHKRDP
jgi:hypothetical protein